jgi:hypothetical protein
MNEEQPAEVSFPWSIEEVEVIADDFFKKKSPSLGEDLRWSTAAREAVAYLRARRRACEKAIEYHRKSTAAVIAARKLSQEREQQLPAVVPYERAVRFITHERKWDRALDKFKKFALHLQQRQGRLSTPNNKTAREAAEKDLQSVRGKSMERQQVVELEQHFLGFWEHHLTSQKHAAGKKGGRPRKNLRES